MWPEARAPLVFSIEWMTTKTGLVSVGAAVVAYTAALYFSHRCYKKGESKVSGDNYVNRGNVFGNMGPTNNFYGKQQYEMNGAQMTAIAKELGARRQVTVFWVGSRHSEAAARKLAAFLADAGFSVTIGGGIMQLMGMETPILISDDVPGMPADSLFVDVDK